MNNSCLADRTKPEAGLRVTRAGDPTDNFWVFYLTDGVIESVSRDGRICNVRFDSVGYEEGRDYDAAERAIGTSRPCDSCYLALYTEASFDEAEFLSLVGGE